jgi:hypothetical protein
MPAEAPDPVLRHLIIAAAFLTCGAVAAAGDAPQDAVAPAQPPQPIERMAEFAVEDEGLTVRTSLRPTNGLTPVEATNLSGTIRADVTLRSRRDRPGGSLFFKLNYASPDAADGPPSVETNLFVRPGYFLLNRVVRTGDELWTASLTQSGDFGRPAAVPLADRDDRVALRVRRLRIATGELTEDIQRSAPSFVELLRRYPNESAEHLGPVFRDFKQEAAVFGADARVAWQVLSGRLPRDPALVPKVKRLVAQLDANDYRERESAACMLRDLGGPAALVLGDLPRDRYSAEQNSRIDTLLAAYRPLSSDVAAERLNDPEFLLSCLAYSEDAVIRTGAAGRLTELTGKPVATSPPTDRDARLALVEKLRRTIDRAPDKGDRRAEGAE